MSSSFKYNPTTGKIEERVNNVIVRTLDDPITNYVDYVPATDNERDIGSVALRYKDLYLGGGIKDGSGNERYLKLDQTTPQTVTGGIPLLTNLTPTSDYHIATKKYVDSAVAGGVSDGDKGDITVSGGGSVWTIDNDAVTYAKIQNVSAENKILGRITAGAGNVEELTAANVRTIINVEDGAEKNVNADWNATSGDALILNKPLIPTQYTDEMAQDAVGGILNNSGNVKFVYDDATPKITATVTETDPVFSASEAALFTDGDAAKLAGIEAGADVTDAANVAAAGAAMAGGAFHDSFSDFVANEHIDWTVDQGLTNIHAGNIPDLSGTYMTVGSVTQYTDEMAQDAVGLNVGTGLAYDDLSGAISCTITQYTDALAVSAIKADADWKADNWNTAYSYLDQAVKTTSSPTFATAKLANLTDGYVPYHSSDTVGLVNSSIYTDGTKVGIGTSEPTTTLDVHGTLSFANTLGDKISLYDDRIGKTGMYGFGAETSTMYYKSSRYHRWYANLNADGGTSDIMELDSDGSLYVKSDICVGVTSINAAAILELSSTTKGFLPPRMTTTQRDAISSPPAGLMIFNTTTKKLNFYSGTAWEAVTSA